MKRIFTAKRFHDLTLAYKTENADYRHAGMDGRHPGAHGRLWENIHVDLDSSSPYWNDAIERVLCRLTDFPRRVLNGGHKVREIQ